MRSLHDHRREYEIGRLVRADLDDDPLSVFVRWFDEAREAGNRDPSAMTLATATKDGRPSARMVLLKSVGPKGFVFATHYTSPKALNLLENPQAALVFYWPETERQVRVEGDASRLGREDSQAIFSARPRQAQIAALIGGQSTPIESRGELEARYGAKALEHPEGEIPVPETWGGYVVAPRTIEFWQGGQHRLHDRFLYSRQDDGSWTITRLMP